MSKTIVFYGRRRMGMCVLSYLVARGFNVKVISEDEDIEMLCKFYNLEQVTLDAFGKFDLFICCHGSKIIPKEKLIKKKFINIHPCLFKYKGRDPIRRYMENKDIYATVESHYMTDKVDKGEILTTIAFTTPPVRTYAEFYNFAMPFYFQCIHETLEKLHL